MGIGVFECTSIQRQFKDRLGSRCNSNSIIIVNYKCVCWCVSAITLSNLLECLLCENVSLVLLWISRVLGTRWQNFLSKILNKIKVDFLQIRHIFLSEMGKASSESWEKQGSSCTPKTFRWTAVWLHQTQKWPVKQKSLVLTPASGWTTTIIPLKNCLQTWKCCKFLVILKNIPKHQRKYSQEDQEKI